MQQAHVSAQALRFVCHGHWLPGVLHAPAAPASRAVLVITGGPQYRVGSHRQFVLLGRHLAAQGFAVMRFDYRGMGDAEGPQLAFDAVADDIRSALDHLFGALPQLRDVVLWGLCDGATAAALYARSDCRVTGLVLVNPWVRSDAGWARATLRHHYGRQLVTPAFWRRLAGGSVQVCAAARALWRLAAAARRHPRDGASLPEQLYTALASFRGRTLIILAGADIGAREFQALPARHEHWRTLLGDQHVRCSHVAHANHTFASRTWRDHVAQLTYDWLTSW